MKYFSIHLSIQCQVCSMFTINMQHSAVNVQHEELRLEERGKLNNHICNQSCSVAEGKQYFKFSLWMIIYLLRTQSSRKLFSVLKNMTLLLEHHSCSYKGILRHFRKFSVSH